MEKINILHFFESAVVLKGNNTRFVFPFVHTLKTPRRYAATLSHLVFYESYSDWGAWMTSNTEGRLFLCFIYLLYYIYIII